MLDFMQDLLKRTFGTFTEEATGKHGFAGAADFAVVVMATAAFFFGGVVASASGIVAEFQKNGDWGAFGRGLAGVLAFVCAWTLIVLGLMCASVHFVERRPRNLKGPRKKTDSKRKKSKVANRIGFFSRLF